MAEFRTASADQADFLAELLKHRVLVDSGVPGIYGRGAVFEDVRDRFDELITREAAEDGAEPLRFPPVMPRLLMESTGYLKSFPHLAGTVFAFGGSEADVADLEERAARHEDWSDTQAMTDIVMVPATCYPVYPAIAARGPLPPGGVTIDPGAAYAFRHEPSGDPARMQTFQMREIVRIGEPDVVQAWREEWHERGLALLRGLGLDAEFDVAADPFFGRAGRMLAASQRDQALKLEILVPITEPEPTALASFNYHQEHFAETFGLELADGGVAHSACLGFGHERTVLALLRAHGLDPQTWPDEVRARLWP